MSPSAVRLLALFAARNDARKEIDANYRSDSLIQTRPEVIIPARVFRNRRLARERAKAITDKMQTRFAWRCDRLHESNATVWRALPTTLLRHVAAEIIQRFRCS